MPPRHILRSNRDHDRGQSNSAPLYDLYGFALGSPSNVRGGVFLHESVICNMGISPSEP